MVEQLEILKHDADAAAQGRQFGVAERGDIAAEEIDQAAGRAQGEEQQLQQRGFSGARGAGEKAETAAVESETDILSISGPMP